MNIILCLMIFITIFMNYSSALAANTVLVLPIGRTTEIKASINWRGEWSVGEDYQNGDAVQSEGSSYICIGEPYCTLMPPGGSWDLMAAAGDVVDSVHFNGNFSSLTNIPNGLIDGDDDTQLSEAEVDTYVANNGYLTGSVSFIDLTNVPVNLDTDSTDDFDGAFSSLTGIPAGLSDGDDNTQLTETEVDTFVANNGYLTGDVSFNDLTDVPVNLDTDSTNDFDGAFSSLTGIPAGLSDGDDNTQLTEVQVDTFVANNGYLTAEVDGSPTNELELPTQSGHSGKYLTTDGSSVSWNAPANTQLSEAEVDTFVANNGYLTAEVDGSTTNEIELPAQGGHSGKFLTTDGSNVSWSATPSGSSAVKTITSNETLTNSDEVVFIHGPYTATFPPTPVDGMKLVICAIDIDAGINGNGKTLYLVEMSFDTTITFGTGDVNQFEFYYSSAMDAWIGAY